MPSSKVGWVLHVIVPEPAGEIGGADLHVFDLALAQKSQSLFQPIVLMTLNEEYADRLKNASIPYIPAHTFGNYLKIILKLAKLPVMKKICLIHSHGYDANYLTYSLRLVYPHTWGIIPTVMTCHGWLENSFFRKVQTSLDFFTYRTANALIVCTAANLTRLSRFKTHRYIKYIPNGIFFPEKRDKSVICKNEDNLKIQYQIPKNRRIVATVGRLSPEKRFDLYLAACKEILNVIEDVHFLIVGSGRERKHLERLAEMYGIKNNVTFTGFIKDINNIYETLSLFILSSDTESTPRVVLEAMSHAVPVVATKVGSLEQLIIHGGSGYLVDRGDTHSLAKFAIYLLQNEKKRVELGMIAYERVNNNFSIWKMQEGVEEVYERILNQKKHKDKFELQSQE